MKNVSRFAPDISVVIPVYNEGANIAPLADELFGALAGRMYYEAIFVDDGSVDDTPDAIEVAISNDPAISMQRHEMNLGQSAAVRTGVRAAKARVVAVIDGDGQNDPDDIPKLYECLVTTPDTNLVIGERLNRKDGWVKRVSSKIANAVRSRMLGDGIRDTGCGIKVFYRDEFLKLPAFDHMHRFLPALVQRDGGHVETMPVRHRPRLNGVSKYGISNRLWVGIADIWGVRWLQKRRI